MTGDGSRILPLILVAWILAWVIASMIYRSKKGKAIIPRKPRNPLFFEGWASGRSGQGIFGILGGGASGCLMVAVVPGGLLLVPRFPFNLMFMPEMLDLEYNIPRRNITAVTVKRGILAKSVKVEFVDVSGGTAFVKLRLKKLDKFLEAIGPVP